MSAGVRGAVDHLNRKFATIFASPFQKALLKATFDDESEVKEKNLTIVVQTLLGGNRDTTSAEAVDALLHRIQENWTWKVILKVLIALHYIVVCPQTTPQWLQSFLADFDVFKACQSFQEAAWGPQADTHAHLIRRYSSFLEVFTNAILKRTSKLCKGTKVSDGMFKDLDSDELVRDVVFIQSVLDKCISVFMDRDKKFLVPTGFCDLTSCCVRYIFKECMEVYTLLNYGVLEILDRLDSLEDEFVEEALERYKLLCDTTDRLMIFCSFMKTLPKVPSESIPVLDAPPPETLAALEKRVAKIRARNPLGTSPAASSIGHRPSSTPGHARRMQDLLDLDEGDIANATNHTANKHLSPTKPTPSPKPYTRQQRSKTTNSDRYRQDSDSDEASGGYDVLSLSGKSPPPPRKEPQTKRDMDRERDRDRERERANGRLNDRERERERGRDEGDDRRPSSAAPFPPTYARYSSASEESDYDSDERDDYETERRAEQRHHTDGARRKIKKKRTAGGGGKGKGGPPPPLSADLLSFDEPSSQQPAGAADKPASSLIDL
ncbi:unnamed protein product [Vitrella brassicaformis CCMP3155]|uniref:AP180 N-terminal homology (ANTH) domain-containing protein n=1 Tax=Vitrella brassicaformis (strain CCMP3155) TaxID=1169540 RepID=A0A0G4EBB0_VITBC|nr:unnamed protein product [Vitrella brassicaformis CCMP3155]|eukprot:CEL92982.1 unnamed protein product [Vitrella brassicaformis CCMP3155]